MWDIMEWPCRECYTQSQCKSAEQNNLPLVKEAALDSPLPLLGQNQAEPFWVSLGRRHRNIGNNRKVRDCSHDLLKLEMFVWDTLSSLENRCESVLIFKGVLHRSFTSPSKDLSPAMAMLNSALLKAAWLLAQRLLSMCCPCTHTFLHWEIRVRGYWRKLLVWA